MVVAMDGIVEKINTLTPKEYHYLLVQLLKPYMDGDHTMAFCLRMCDNCGSIDIEISGVCGKWYYDLCEKRNMYERYYCETQLCSKCMDNDG